MRHIGRSLIVGCVCLGLAAGAAFGQPLQVGAGTNHARLIINFKDGAAYDFDVAFTDAMTGLGLFDAAEAAGLTTVRMDFGFGMYVDGIAYGTHTNSGFGGGEDWWHYWIKDSASADWESPMYGASDRTPVLDGYSDGWVYGSAGPPVAIIPEPATLALVALGAAAAWRRRRT